MVTHIVWWTLKPEAAPDTLARFIKEINGLVGKIPGLRGVQVGGELLSTSSETADVVLCSTHDDAAALKVYADHPEHLKVAAIMKEAAASRRCIDFVS